MKTKARGATRVLIVADLPDFVVDDFSAQFEAVRGPIEAAHSGQFQAIVISVETRMTAEIIASLPDCVKLLATYSVGTDHIDLAALRARRIALLSTPDVLADSVAEVALLLMLGAARRATESIDLVRGGQWQGWSPRQLNGVQLAGRRLGIFGMGSIGQRIASRAQAFDMAIAYTNRSPIPPDRVPGAEFVASGDELLGWVDMLVLSCPSTAETRGFLNRPRIASARPGLIVVNIGRGDLIVDDALVEGLKSGHIRAAGLDVFAGEPLYDRRYLSLPNVFMLPHIGSSTIEARRAMGRILIDGIESACVGRRG